MGCWKGLSTSFIGPACRDNGTALWCVDSWKGSSDVWGPDYAARLAKEDVRAAFERNMAELEVPVSILPLPSVQAAARFAHCSCDLVFLDASHDEASVLADLEAWYPKVRPGGLLAGHDFDPAIPGVSRALLRFTAIRGLTIRRGPGRLWYL